MNVIPTLIDNLWLIPFVLFIFFTWFGLIKLREWMNKVPEVNNINLTGARVKICPNCGSLKIAQIVEEDEEYDYCEDCDMGKGEKKVFKKIKSNEVLDYREKIKAERSELESKGIVSEKVI